MLDKMSDTSRIVDRLIIKGLVKKAVSAGDRRLVDVQLTDKGKKLLQQMDSLNDEFDAVFRNLSTEEAAKLNELLDKIRSADKAV
jgi:DNA-binding MarR family transcriptional regulator